MDSIHIQLIDWIDEADTTTANSRKIAEKCRDYYNSNQWTAAERKAIERRKQAPVVRNRIKPKMDGILGMEQQNRTAPKSLARTPKHEKAASAASQSIRYVTQKNDYHNLRSQAFENMIIEGCGGFEVIVERKGDKVEIKIKHILWDRMIYDAYSRRKDFSDARWLGQVVWLDRDIAEAKYPNAKGIFDTMLNGSSTYDDKPTWVDGKRKRVKIVEIYWKQGGDTMRAVIAHGGFVEDAAKSPYLNEDGETVWPYEYASLFIDTDGGRYGAEKQLLDIQDEINKRSSKALHLMSVRQTMFERGAVDDINKARQELAKPDGMVEVVPGMKFELLDTGDMAQAQFNLLAEAKAEIDQVGFNAAASGKEDRNMSGVALRARAATGQTELNPIFDQLKHLDIRVYRKIWNLVRQYWDSEIWIRVTDDTNNLKFVGLNKPMTAGEQMLKQAEEQGAPTEQLQQMAMQIQQDPAMQQIVETENEVASLDVDIIITDAPDTLTTQMEDFQSLSEMVKSGFPMPPLAVIKASPISNKDEIIKMMEEQNGGTLSPQAQQQMQQMQEQMQMMQEEAQKLTEENKQLKSGVMEAQAKLQLSAQESQAKLEQSAQESNQKLMVQRESANAELQLKAEISNAELAMERNRIEQQFALEQYKIEKQIELERMKAEMKFALDSAAAVHSGESDDTIMVGLEN